MPLARKIEEAGTDDTEGHMPRVKVPAAAVDEDVEGHMPRVKVPAAAVDEDVEGHMPRDKSGVAPATTDGADGAHRPASRGKV